MTDKFSIREVHKLGRPGTIVTVRDTDRFAGAHVRFENGWVLSVQWGRGNYSDNYNLLSPSQEPPADSTTAEIAAWRGDDGDLMEWVDGDTVQGWCSWERVQHVLDLLAEDKLLKHYDVSATPLARLDDGFREPVPA